MISTGTERLVASGKIGLDFQDKMSVPYMQGDFGLPIKYGYSLVVKDSKGRMGHIMHPHQNKVDIDQGSIYWTNSKIPPSRFSLVSNMETVINAIWDGNPTKEQNVAICGFGNVGSLLANTLKVHYNIDVDIIEKNNWRKSKAKELGFNLSTNKTYDIIYHTSATEKGLQFCIDHLNFEGRVIELSWYGDKSISLNLGRDFHYKRLKIISSQVSNIPRHRSKETYKSRKDFALELLQDQSYDDLITDRLNFEDTPNFYDRLRRNEHGEGLIYIIEY